MRTIAVVLAGGAGKRSGFDRPKQLVKLGGRPIIAHSLERLQAHSGIDEIAIVTSEDCVREVEALVNRERLVKVKRILLGGKERHDSSLSAIRSYEADAAAGDLNLLFHDAVRPLISQTIISDVINALEHYHAVDTAIPAADTVIITDPTTNTIAGIPDRATIRLGQTPQGFRYEAIKTAYDRARLDKAFRTTDDCGVVLKYAPEYPIAIVEGATTNLKLTYEDDLLVLDKFMQSGAGRRCNGKADLMALSHLRDKTLLVLGGTSGIGASMVKLAQAFGAHVVAAGRSTGVNIADAASVQEILEQTTRQFGLIHAVVNSAATLTRQPLCTMTPAEILESVNTNFVGALNVARLSYEHLRQSRGHLLLFASSSYTYGRAFYSTYSASKAAVVNLTQALADEWNDEAIKVNCINPERARTPMRRKAFGKEPRKSLLDPDEVATKALGVLVSGATGMIYDIVKS